MVQTVQVERREIGKLLILPEEDLENRSMLDGFAPSESIEMVMTSARSQHPHNLTASASSCRGNEPERQIHLSSYPRNPLIPLEALSENDKFICHLGSFRQKDMRPPPRPQTFRRNRSTAPSPPSPSPCPTSSTRPRSRSFPNHHQRRSAPVLLRHPRTGRVRTFVVFFCRRPYWASSLQWKAGA